MSTITIAGTPVIQADRVEIKHASDWDDSSGSDFFMQPTAAQIAVGVKESLSDFGWTTTTLAYVPGSGSDFMASADRGIPNHFNLADAADKIQSPDLFGNYAHALQAQPHLGKFPSQLIMTVWAQFAVASQDENDTGFGFVVAGGGILTAADALAVIRSDGTNFFCRSSADTKAGAAIDTNWHHWKIVIHLGTTDKIEWFIDDVSQGTLDLLEDAFPMPWGAGNVGGGVNRLKIGDLQIVYR